MSDSNASNAIMTLTIFYSDALANLSANASQVEKQLEAAKLDSESLQKVIRDASSALVYGNSVIRQLLVENQLLRDAACQPPSTMDYKAVGERWSKMVEPFGL